MSLLSKILSKGASDLIKSGGDVIDNIATNDEEKLKAKNELTNIVLGSLNNMQNAQRDVLLAESSGTWLQRSWRPIVMLTFTAMIVTGAFVEIPYLDNDSKFWILLEIGLGGYVIGRSVEKIANNVTKNADLTFIKRKERKDIYG